ncbi:MAG: M20 family metallopeptidase [Acidimicrobiales bacterium]|nr:M20 family metallopeptidase [Acidimicrobiales bacterium]
MDVIEAKQQVRAEIERLTPTLLEISHEVHANPELNFEEHFAHEMLSGVLEDEGLDVERGAYDLSTAFDARVGTSGPTIAVCCEYDALPGIGHACGHNIIAAAGIGAGLAAATVAEALGGRLAILGTPAEEGGGGKEFMIRGGAFDDVDAAMMVHPADHDLRSMHTIAFHTMDVEYEGQAAHAAAAPHKGRNALDAAVLGYTNVAALRQHIRPEERIHGVFTEAGDKPNIVPARAAAEWYVRSATMESLEPLKQRVLACLEAGASATGCTMTHRWNDPPFYDMIDNTPLLDLYCANAEQVGRVVHAPDPMSVVSGSTDMGNVSYAVPAIHPMIKVAPAGCAIHTPEFATHARSEEGDRAVIDGALSMALTIVDLWADAETLGSVRGAFEETQ